MHFKSQAFIVSSIKLILQLYAISDEGLALELRNNFVWITEMSYHVKLQYITGCPLIYYFNEVKSRLKENYTIYLVFP